MIKCPFCNAKSDKFFSVCNHIIACFEPHFFDPIFVHDNIINLIKREGFPLKCLRDFLRNFPDTKTITHENERYNVFYVENRDKFQENFHNYLLDTSFSEIKINLRQFYWLFSLVFDKHKPDTKIRPTFEPIWFLNLDFKNLPNKFLKDCLKEMLNREQKGEPYGMFPEGYIFFSKENLQYTIDNFEGDPEIHQRASDMLYQIVLDDELFYYNISKWILKYMKDNLYFQTGFSKLFEEKEITEILEFLKIDLEECYPLPAFLNNLIKPFDAFKTFRFLEKFIKISKHDYFNLFEKPGIFTGLRNFLVEMISVVAIKHKLNVDLGDIAIKKIGNLANNNIIDEIMKNKLFFIWKQLSILVHEPNISEKVIQEIHNIKKILVEDILPTFANLI